MKSISSMSEITSSTESFPPVFKEIPFQDPFKIYRGLRSCNSFLFESVKGPENIARYSFIGTRAVSDSESKRQRGRNRLSRQKNIVQQKPASETERTGERL